MRLISLLLLVLTGCSLAGGTQSSSDLPTRLYQHIGSAVSSYEDADALWQAVLDGDSAVNCSETFSIPDFFDLTVPEAQTYPVSVDIRDNINEAILLLEQVNTIWQIECQQDAPTVSITTLRQVETLLDQAQAALYEANAAWAAWQS